MLKGCHLNYEEKFYFSKTAPINENFQSKPSLHCLINFQKGTGTI